MKNLFLTFLFIIPVISGFSQKTKIRPYHSAPYPDNIETISFTVLDINYDSNLVAFKHVYVLRTVYDEIGELYEQPCNCHYIGMQENPLAGVILGVYDLSKQEYLKTFTIYKSVYYDSLCMSYEESKKALDSAKAFFKNHNLDISQKPQPVLFKKLNRSEYELDIAGRHFHSTSERGEDSENFTYEIISKLYYYNQPIYTIIQEDDFVMASGGVVQYIAAYKKGNKIVFLNKFYHENHMAGETDRETYHFTPVFNISKL